MTSKQKTERETPRESRLCSVVSRAAGDDPGGTAPAFGAYLGIELAPPWKSNVTESRYVPGSLLQPLQRVVSAGVVDKVTALMPDPEHSHGGYTHILYMKRPEGSFAAYTKREYLLPERELVSFVGALSDPDALSRFEPYRRDTSHVRDILVCTHGARDVCCAKFGYPIYETLRHDYAEPDKLRVWRTSHIGGHRFAPTLMDFPEGRYWGHLEPEVLENLVLRNGCTSDLRRFCRGWAGLTTRCEQIAECEILAQEGWDWVGYLKAGRTNATSEDGQCAEVRIEYASPDSEVCGVYEATVEAAGSVMTLGSSGTDALEEVPQYRVSRLEKRTGSFSNAPKTKKTGRREDMADFVDKLNRPNRSGGVR